ncbi:hypothetical protein BDN71DRAFT_1507379 [Pleurotus eryngii]|uniref:Uncharacterized protein n=1 Tax=Pleurotus eryngii TaxID=5323 RepID=A0A9P5ZX06_PLEER|nr:hypothetical protein BDN71DRAFT_1507379 [Pleurotus eryngii]
MFYESPAVLFLVCVGDVGGVKEIVVAENGGESRAAATRGYFQRSTASISTPLAHIGGGVIDYIGNATRTFLLRIPPSRPSTSPPPHVSPPLDSNIERQIIDSGDAAVQPPPYPQHSGWEPPHPGEFTEARKPSSTPPPIAFGPEPKGHGDTGGGVDEYWQCIGLFSALLLPIPRPSPRSLARQPALSLHPAQLVSPSPGSDKAHRRVGSGRRRRRVLPSPLSVRRAAYGARWTRWWMIGPQVGVTQLAGSRVVVSSALFSPSPAGLLYNHRPGDSPISTLLSRS